MRPDPVPISPGQPLEEAIAPGNPVRALEHLLDWKDLIAFRWQRAAALLRRLRQGRRRGDLSANLG
jgi:hypothetical protein